MALSDDITALLRGCLAGRQEWDEPPGLHVIYRDGGGVRLGGGLVPAEMWAMAPPPAILAALAGDLERSAPLAASLLPAPALGVAFRYESWSLIVPEGRAAELAEADAAGREHRIHAHPDRVEQRAAWAVLRGGAHYSATQSRGSDDIEAGKIPGPSGLIPESLERIARALTAGAN